MNIEDGVEARGFDRVIIIDGHCVLCHGFCQWIMRLDWNNRFAYTHLQSQFMVELKIKGLEVDKESVLYLKNGEIWSKSDAVLEIMNDLHWMCSCFKLFKIVPRAWRDKIYSWVARNRYRWFGTRESCTLPFNGKTILP